MKHLRVNKQEQNFTNEAIVNFIYKNIRFLK